LQQQTYGEQNHQGKLGQTAKVAEKNPPTRYFTVENKSGGIKTLAEQEALNAQQNAAGQQETRFELR